MGDGGGVGNLGSPDDAVGGSGKPGGAAGDNPGSGGSPEENDAILAKASFNSLFIWAFIFIGEALRGCGGWNPDAPSGGGPKVG